MRQFNFFYRYVRQDATNVEEGKSGYRKYVRSEANVPFRRLLELFASKFQSFSRHLLESWLLNAINDAGRSKEHWPLGVVFSVSDFAENLQHNRRREVGEEHFYKESSTLSCTVSGIIRDGKPDFLSQFCISSCK